MSICSTRRLVFTLLTIAFFGSSALTGCSESQQNQNQAPPPPAVDVATPIVDNITNWDEYTGRLEAVDYVEVRARVSGSVESVHFNEGALVKKGDLLYVIDPRPYQAIVDQARASVEQAQVRLDLAGNDLARAKRLFNSKAISAEELDARTQEEKQALANLQASRATVRSAELNLEFTEVKAPISGRIGRDLETPGNLISGGTSQSTLLTTIVSQDPIHVYFTADERAYLKYIRLDREGSRPSSRDTANPVYMKLADEELYTRQGTMDFVDNRVDEATGTMQGRAVFANPDYVLTPGLFAKVKLLGEGPYRAILIPDSAVGTDQAQKFVYVVDSDNKAQRRNVTLDRKHQGFRIVSDGLDGNEQVIINGLQRVRPGAPVTPEEKNLDYQPLDANPSENSSNAGNDGPSAAEGSGEATDGPES